MKKICLFILAILFVNQTTFAQITFQKGYGGVSLEEAKSIYQTYDHGYIIAGHSYSFGQGVWDAYLIKTDSLGEILWTWTFGDSDFDYIYSVTEAADSGIVAVGYTFNFNSANKDIYLIKTNASGTLLWSKTIGWPGDDEGHSVRQTFDGGFIICGEAILNGRGACLIKTDSNGDVIWSKKYDEVNFPGYDEYGFSAEQTTDSGFIMLGSAENSFCVGGSDIYLTKTDSSGNIQWNKLFGGTDHEFGYSVKQTTDGGFILTGTTLSYGAGNEDAYLIKTDANGDTLWCKTYGGVLRDYCYSVSQTTDGGYILTGYSENFGAGGNDYYLIKLNGNGTLQWSKTFGANSDERAYDVIQTVDGGYAVAGSTDGLGLEATSFYIIKTDINGNSGCQQGNAITSVGGCPFTIGTPAMTAVLGGTYSNPSTLISSGGSDSTFCLTVSGINDLYNNSILTYPNPFSSHLTLTGVSEKGIIDIFDMTGQNILRLSSSANQITIETKNFIPGLYLIRYSEGEKIINTRVLKM